MSGTDGGTWVDQTGDECATLAQQTVLNSPNQAVLQVLQKGDILDVVVRKTASGTVVVEALHNGQVAGAITSSIIQRLAECVEQGHDYVAEVIDDVQGGVCRVHVHSK